ncbi:MULTISPECIES: hypothetical protein [Bacteria]|uniref:hypothetical protein n=1 Tax=Bacteria TaxID=2 RepID=UPI003C79D90F
MSDPIRAVVDDVIAEHHGRVATHWDGCWKWHAACLAHLIRGHLEEEGETDE